MVNSLFPALSWVDSALAVLLPLVTRVFLYGLVSGVLSILIYKMISNQEKIAALKSEGREIRQHLLDADLSEFKSLVARNTKVSGLLLGSVFVPSLVAAIPVLVFASWIAVFHSYEIADDQITVELERPASGYSLVIGSDIYELPASSEGFVVPVSADVINLQHEGQTLYSGTPFDPPVPAVTLRPWWAFLLENEAGYLAEGSGIEALRFAVAPKKLIPGLPNFLAGGEAVFFVAVFVAALGLKLVLRVE